MNRDDAYKLLAGELEQVRARGYGALSSTVDPPPAQKIVRVGSARCRCGRVGKLGRCEEAIDSR